MLGVCMCPLEGMDISKNSPQIITSPVHAPFGKPNHCICNSDIMAVRALFNLTMRVQQHGYINSITHT